MIWGFVLIFGILRKHHLFNVDILKIRVAFEFDMSGFIQNFLNEFFIFEQKNFSANKSRVSQFYNFFGLTFN